MSQDALKTGRMCSAICHLPLGEIDIKNVKSWVDTVRASDVESSVCGWHMLQDSRGINSREYSAAPAPGRAKLFLERRKAT